MTIAIDIRPLVHDRGGVAEYVRSLICSLVALDDGNEYVLFSAGMRRPHIPREVTQSSRVRFLHVGIPSKILNFFIFLFHWPSMNQMIDWTLHRRIDLFFAPNGDFFSVDRATPVLLTLHDLSFEFYPHFFSLKSRVWHKAIVLRKKTRNAAHIIAVSESTKNDIVHFYGIDAEKISIIHLGAPAIQNKTDPLIEGRYVLALGLNDDRKNISFLVDAFAAIREKHDHLKSVKLVLVGSSRGSLTHNAHVNDSWIIRIPFCGRETLQSLFHSADVLAYPSIYEGFGLPPLEACRAGVPVIASANSSISEVLGDAALLIDPYDRSSLAHALIEVLTDSALRDMLIERGRRKAEEYSWMRTAIETVQCFHAVLKKDNCVSEHAL